MHEDKTRQEWADDLLNHSVKLKELEERIRQLEARPYPIVQPYPVPTWPGDINPVWTWPASPTYPPWPFAPYTTWC